MLGHKENAQQLYFTPQKKQVYDSLNKAGSISGEGFSSVYGMASSKKACMSSPQTLFTPLKIPGSSKEDSSERKNAIISQSCYCVPDYGLFTLSHIKSATYYLGLFQSLSL